MDNEIVSDVKSHLERTVTWKVGLYLAIASILDWVYLSGPAIAAVGKWAPLAWLAVVVLQIIALLSILEVAVMYKDSAGGISTYVIKAYEHRSPLIGPLAMWGYFMGWGLAIGAVALFAGFFIQYFIPDFNIVVGALLTMLVCLVVNLRGIEASGRMQSLITLVFVATIITIIASVVQLPVIPYSGVPDMLLPENNPFVAIAGILFLLAWSGYAIEAVLTIVPEYLDPIGDTKKATIACGMVYAVMTTLICLALILYLPLEVTLNDPFTPLLPLAEMALGSAFAYGFGVILIIGLILNTNLCFVATSRVLYEAANTGYLPRIFGKLNKNKAPAAALVFLFLVNAILVIAVGEAPLFLLVAGNIGYFVVIILSNFTPYVMRHDFPDITREYRVSDYWIYAGVGVGIINIILLIVGALSYGLTNLAVGCALLLTVYPLYFYRTKVEDKKMQASATDIKGDEN
ncbi:APC family permease [Methanohalophilus profundi]|uniref:APC family permease n=1 Tax=Methanohalophilus profundi TaxID=2138083 RepID=UPI00101CE54D|nr:APC family permease [Methanohalophilus profundi]